MENQKFALPEMSAERLYAFSSDNAPNLSTSTMTDNTTTCTTVLTTTRIDHQ